MKRALLAACAALGVFGMVGLSLADPPHGRHGGDDDYVYREGPRQGPPSHAPAWGHREKHKEWRAYDWNRPPAHERYYADRYYRGGAYAPIVVTRATRIYRGNDGRYYCRRSDGSTGLIVGAAIGGLIGNQLGRGDSNLMSTLIGAGAGAVLGREIDRGSLRCR